MGADGTQPEEPRGLLEHIGSKKPSLAGFLEACVRFELNDDTLRVIAGSDIYVRYVAAQKDTISAMASEHYGRPINLEIAVDAAADRASKGSHLGDQEPEPSAVEPPEQQHEYPNGPGEAAASDHGFRSSAVEKAASDRGGRQEARDTQKRLPPASAN